MRILFFICAITLLASCRKAGPDRIPDGNYHGTFQRITPASSGPLAQVTLTFSDNRWSGQSSQPTYPALCNGTYQHNSGSEFQFTDECMWLAYFDWSLILNGAYDISLNGSHLTIKRTDIGKTDVYELERE